MVAENWNHYTIDDVLATGEKGRRGGKNQPNGGSTDGRTVDSVISKVRKRRNRLTWLDAVGVDLEPGAFGGGSGRLVEEFDFRNVGTPERRVCLNPGAVSTPREHAP